VLESCALCILASTAALPLEYIHLPLKININNGQLYAMRSFFLLQIRWRRITCVTLDLKIVKYRVNGTHGNRLKIISIVKNGLPCAISFAYEIVGMSTTFWNVRVFKIIGVRFPFSFDELYGVCPICLYTWFFFHRGFVLRQKETFLWAIYTDSFRRIFFCSKKRCVFLISTYFYQCKLTLISV